MLAGTVRQGEDYLSPETRSPARPDDTTSENAPTSVLGKSGTVTVLMRIVSNGATTVAANPAEIALFTGRGW